MNAWLIYDQFEAERNKHYIQMYFDECSKRGIQLRLLISEDLTIGIRENKCSVMYLYEKLPAPHFVICRTIRPLLTKHLEIMGIPVFNNYFVSSVCNDKQKTYQYVSQANIRMMDSIFTNTDYTGEITYPVVVKPSNGKGGKNVFLVRNSEEYHHAVKAMSGTDIIIQKPAGDLGRDLRVYVIGKRIIASILRVSQTDFRSNYCLGGSAELYDLSHQEKSIIDKVIEMFDFGLVGIDFIFDQGQLVFNEIEDVVGSRMIYAKTDINIVSEYLEYILTKV